MEEVNSRSISLKWAFVFALISLIYSLGTAIARVQLPFIGWFIGVAIISFCFAMAFREFKAANGGYMSFGKGFGMAMFISLIGGLVRSIVFYVYMMTDTGYLDFIRDAQRDSPFGPPPDDAQTEQMQGFIDFFTGPEFIAIVMFVAAIFGGLILGAIVSAIMKNEEEEY